MNLKIALAIYLLIVAIYLWWPSTRSNFTTPDEIRQEAKVQFDKTNGAINFSALKNSISKLDNSMYNDLRTEWINGKL